MNEEEQLPDAPLPMTRKQKHDEYRALGLRDGESCQWCGRGPTETIPLAADLIDPNGDDEIGNKQLLCLSCSSQRSASPDDDKTVRWSSALFQRGFTMIPNLVLASDVLDVYAFRVYSLLLYYARQDDACWPGQEGLASLVKCSDRQVRVSVRALEAVGLVKTRRRGRGDTNVYILLVPRAERGSGLDQARPEAGAGLDRNVVPGNKKQVTKTKDSSSSKPRNGRLPGAVGGKKVSSQEHDLCDAILSLFNEAFATAFQAPEYRRGIIMRIREHPELQLAEHTNLIEHMKAHPWWRGAPSPAVIYGKGTTFERALHRQEGGGSDDPFTGLTAV